MAKKQRIDPSIGENEKKVLKWSPHMDDVLIDALLEQVNGNRIDGVFTTNAYTCVLKKITSELNYPFEKDHIKNHMRTLKTNFNVCYDLFRGLSGFAWDPKLFDAEPETWRDLLHAKPSTKKWKATLMLNYDKLLELFGKDRATGASAECAKEKEMIAFVNLFL